MLVGTFDVAVHGRGDCSSYTPFLLGESLLTELMTQNDFNENSLNNAVS
jgi:hypothetical protein